jgi:acyl-coenzyme A thioesterase PaaI-like protein
MKIGTTIHGGTLASLIDTAAMVAAWADNSISEKINGIFWD